MSGRTGDRAEAQQVLDRVRRLAGQYLAADGKLIDRLEVATTSQVDVKVYVLEIDDTGLKQLGLRPQGASPTPRRARSSTRIPNIRSSNNPIR